MLHYRSSVAREPTYYGYPTFGQSKQRVDNQIIKQLTSRYQKQLVLVCAASAVVVIALLATTVVFANMFDSKDDSTTPALLNFPGEATLDGTFVDEMYDKNSDEFKQVESDFCSKVDSVVMASPASSQYSACAVDSIRNGSLEISFTLTMSPSDSSNLTDIHTTLDVAVRRSNVALGARQATLRGVETVRVAYDDDSCVSSPCDAGTSCHDLPVGYVCLTVPAPEPEIDYCAGDPCENGGTCHNTTDDYVCACVFPYSDKICSTAPVPEVDYCAGNPCENGGTCGNMTSDYICACVFPYSGKTCSMAPDPEPDYCAGGPCENGGACYNTTGDYLCSCPDGYSGKNCSIVPIPDIDYCFGDPCENGGICYNTTGEYICDCVFPYSGKNCSIAPMPEVDYCAGNPCENDGTCGNMTSDYVCACVFPYSGKNCTIVPDPDIDYCAGNPCENDGTCGNMTSDFICACMFPYSGKTCSIAPDPDIDYCAGSPCENSGICYNTTGDYLCSCPDGYSGKNCSIAPNPEPDYCAGNPCENGGICYNTTGEYICDCVFPYSGKNCSIAPDPVPDYCTPDPCQNGGICHNSTEGHLCVCVSPFTGTNCSMAVCDRGQRFNGTVCEDCSFGSFAPFKGSPSCKPCPKGTSTMNTASICRQECDVCLAGYEPAGLTCQQCPPGKFKAPLGSDACAECPRGSYTGSAGQTKCLICPPGTYAPTTGTTECLICNGIVDSSAVSCDLCGSAPCENGGVCANLDTHYSCSCKAHFFDGLNCENDCQGRTNYWCQPSGWPPLQPSVYLPFENSDNYTLWVKDTSVQPTTVKIATDQDIVLGVGVVDMGLETLDTQFQMVALGMVSSCIIAPEACKQGFTFTGWFTIVKCIDSALITGRRNDGYTNSFSIECNVQDISITVGSSVGYFLGQATWPADGRWHHLAVTMTHMNPMGIMTSYLDGRKWFEFATLHTQHIPGQPQSSGELVISKKSVEPTMIGNYNSQKVDEIAIFDQVLTPEQIYDIYAMTSDSLPPTA